MNATSTVTLSSSRFSSAATQRALLHMPCAICRGKPKALAVSAVQVDRVAVARTPRRSAGRGRRRAASRRRSRRRPARSPAPGGGRVLVAAAAAQERRDAPPTPPRRRRETSVITSKTRPLACGRRFSDHTLTSTFSLGVIARCWVMTFSRCTVPMAGNGNVAVGHQRHVQRERQHVRVGQRQRRPWAGSRRPRRTPRRGRGRPRRPCGRGSRSGSVAARLPDPGERRDPRQGRECRLDHEAEAAGAPSSHARGSVMVRRPASSGRRPGPRCR